MLIYAPYGYLKARNDDDGDAGPYSCSSRSMKRSCGSSSSSGDSSCSDSSSGSNSSNSVVLIVVAQQ